LKTKHFDTMIFFSLYSTVQVVNIKMGYPILCPLQHNLIYLFIISVSFIGMIYLYFYDPFLFCLFFYFLL
jgi:hypothetical protein